MKINLKVRLQHKPFLVALFAAILVLVQAIAEPFGVDVTLFNQTATTIFNAVLGVLIILGVVIDPTTEGASDSKQAMGYNKPRDDLDGGVND